METLTGSVIGAIGAIAAAIVGVEWQMRRRRRVDASKASRGTTDAGTVRSVFYSGTEHRFLNFGGKNCRIERMDGGESFLAPTHQLFHDQGATRRITRDSIVVRS